MYDQICIKNFQFHGEKYHLTLESHTWELILRTFFGGEGGRRRGRVGRGWDGRGGEGDKFLE